MMTESGDAETRRLLDHVTFGEDERAFDEDDFVRTLLNCSEDHGTGVGDHFKSGYDERPFGEREDLAGRFPR